jgi:outer membrane immunogenic protein
MRKLLLCALSAGSMAVPAFVASPALAQDAASFSGPRVEGVVGWDRPKAGGEHQDGVAGGVGAGYDFRSGGAVFGVEGEATLSTAKDCTHDVLVTGDKLCAKAKRDLYVGGRVGTIVATKTLLYAKAGYSNARFGAEYKDGGTGAANSSTASNLDGIRVGGGVEHELSGRSYVKAEYRYSNYEKGAERHQLLAGVGVRF